MRRSVARAFWRIANPLALLFAGVVPWWVVLETRGRRSGRPRRVPLASGVVEGSTVWLIAVHGRHSGFAHNIAAAPEVRLKMRGRWHDGTASLQPLEPALLARFSRYARSGPTTVGIDPALVKVELR